MRKTIIAEFIILLAGTLFAWVNFGFELSNWLHKRACSCTANLTNPFLTPCFYGAIFFSIAFILSVLIVKGSKKI